MPTRILDLYAEFRCLTSGLKTPCGNGLLGALAYFGLDAIEAAEKDSMRQLAIRGGPYTTQEQTALLDYCQTDVDALAKLLPVMLPRLDLPRALVRGRYMAAVAQMEWNGVPIDMDALTTLRANWEVIQEKLIQRIDLAYGVFDGRTFKSDRWAAWLAQNNIPWPRLESGSLALDDETFRSMAGMYPEVAPIRELRTSLSQLRLSELAVGSDGRNRCLLSPFSSKTGEPTEQQPLYFWSINLAPQPYSPGCGNGGCLRRLRATGVWSRRRPFGRLCHAVGLPQRRSVSGLCSAGGGRAAGCHETNPPVPARAI